MGWHFVQQMTCIAEKMPNTLVLQPTVWNAVLHTMVASSSTALHNRTAPDTHVAALVQARQPLMLPYSILSASAGELDDRPTHLLFGAAILDRLHHLLCAGSVSWSSQHTLSHSPLHPPPAAHTQTVHCCASAVQEHQHNQSL